MSFVLGLLLAACDLRSVTELLADLQPPPAEAADDEAAAGDSEAASESAEDDDADDASEDDADGASGSGESGADEARERCLNRNEHVGNLRDPSRVTTNTQRTRRVDREDAPSEADDAPADDQQEETEEQPAQSEPAPSSNGNGGGSGDAAGQSSGLSDVEQQVFDLLNAERQRAGLSPLQLDSELSQGSRAWSRRMATEGFFDHDRSGNFAENIAYGYPTAAAVHEGWMSSEGHRDNRMNSRYTTYGVGVYQQGDTLYYTERFR
jgi:uncharacterized protein YkwD